MAYALRYIRGKHQLDDNSHTSEDPTERPLHNSILPKDASEETLARPTFWREAQLMAGALAADNDIYRHAYEGAHLARRGVSVRGER